MAPTLIATLDYIVTLEQVMADNGLAIPDRLIPNGHIHRYAVQGDKAGTKNGWYIIFPDDNPTCVFGSWKSDQKIIWSVKKPQDLSLLERPQYRQRIAQAQQEAEEARKGLQQEAGVKAKAIWEELLSAPSEHPYLARKHIQPLGVRVSRGKLVIPAYGETGTIATLQFIGEDGTKRFLRHGAKTGNYFTMGEPGKIVYVVEGFATGATVYEATGAHTVVAFDADNLKPVVLRLRDKYPDAQIIIAADNDSKADGNPGLTKGKKASEAVNGSVVYPMFKDMPGNGEPLTDFNDLMIVEGIEVVHKQLQPPQAGEGDVEAEIDRLAALSLLDYAKVRKESGKRLEIGLGLLDGLVKTRRREQGKGKILQGKEIVFDEPIPADEEVDGSKLLQRLIDFFERFLVLPSGSSTAMALWTIHVYGLEAFGINPRLALLSPEKRSGKTTALDLLSVVVPKPLPCSNITPSAIFRVVEKASPTLILDEMDSFQESNEELRGILNSGHTRTTAHVIRTVGDDFEPRSFSTWSPMILAAIGSLPDTLEDRSVIVRIQRKKKTDKVERLVKNVKDSSRFKEEIETIKRKIIRWVADHLTELRSAEPDLIKELGDRAYDNWSGLLSIAKLCGEEWLSKAKSQP